MMHNGTGCTIKFLDFFLIQQGCIKLIKSDSKYSYISISNKFETFYSLEYPGKKVSRFPQNY